MGKKGTKNMIRSFIRMTVPALGLAAWLVTSGARAADDDEAACAGKAEGDACTEADGEKGTCEPDTDTGVLECEDPAGSGCSVSGTSGHAEWLIGFGLLGVITVHRARSLARARVTPR